MAYFDVALLARDSDFLARIIACAVAEDIPQAEGWAQLHRWEIAGAPGFGDAYASALAGNVVNPGRDQAVISDGMILSAVQATNG